MARSSPLPFSLSNPTTKLAIEHLGINPDDLEYRPLHYFMNSGGNHIIAKRAFELYSARRDELINKIREERIKILNSRKNCAVKEAPEVLVERYKTQVNEQQLVEKEATNQAILRRLAINELRKANKRQRCEDLCSRCDEVTKAHTEQKTKLMEEAKLAADTSGRRERPMSTNDLAPYYAILRRSNVDHDELYRTALAEKKKKFEAEVERTNKGSEEARKRKENHLNATIDRRRQRMERVDRAGTLYRERSAAKSRLLEERGEIRDERTKVIAQRQKDIEKTRRDKAMRRITREDERFEAVKDIARNEMQVKIDAERAILERRNEAAAKIFKRQEDEIEDYRQHLEQRDDELAQRIEDHKTQIYEKLADEREILENKTSAVRQAKRSRECATACAKQRKLSRNYSSLADVRRQRIASELAKVTAEERFADTRTDLLSLAPRLRDMSDTQKAQMLMGILSVSETEALEMLKIAKTPASLH